MGNAVVHFEIGCRDREKSDAFYTSLFDWKTAEYGPLSKSLETGSPSGIPGFITALGHEPHNYVMIYVEVDDVAASCERARQLGGKIVVGETEVPGRGAFAWIRDIDGNLLGLWKGVRA